MISFGAKYISSAKVQKVSRANDFKDEIEVSCVELDPNRPKDVNAALETASLWESKEGYEDIMSLNLSFLSRGELTENLKFYAITTQKDDFDNPDGSKIVAMSQVNVRGNRHVELEYIQAKPKEVSILTEPCIIKHAGTEMLNLIKSVFKGYKITLYSTQYTPGFYRKNNFKEDKRISNKFTYDA